MELLPRHNTCTVDDMFNLDPQQDGPNGPRPDKKHGRYPSRVGWGFELVKVNIPLSGIGVTRASVHCPVSGRHVLNRYIFT